MTVLPKENPTLLKRLAAVVALLTATPAAAQMVFSPANPTPTATPICQFIPNGWCGLMQVCRPTEPNFNGEPQRAFPANPRSTTQPMGPQNVTEVPLGRNHGTFTLPATVNGMTTLSFTLDSGASAAVIPRGVAEELIRNGTLTEDDCVGPGVSSLADGNVHRNDVIILNSITVGGQTVNDVECVVGDEGSRFCSARLS